jgi:hypothetical protein
MTLVITGLIGLAMAIAFLGFMVIWVPAPPLIIIIVGVMALAVFDFVQTVRGEESSSPR